MAQQRLLKQPGDNGLPVDRIRDDIPSLATAIGDPRSHHRLSKSVHEDRFECTAERKRRPPRSSDLGIELLRFQGPPRCVIASVH